MLGEGGRALRVVPRLRYVETVAFIDGPGAGFDFPGEMMCPDIVNQYCRQPDYVDEGSTKLALHGLANGNRDIYLTVVAPAADALSETLTCSGLERLTDWPGDEKFPQLYSGWDETDGFRVPWCFFIAGRDSDWGI